MKDAVKSLVGISLLCLSISLVSANEYTPQNDELKNCGFKKIVQLDYYLQDIVDNVIVIEIENDAALLIPEGERILNGSGLRILVDKLCLPYRSQLKSFKEGEMPEKIAGTGNFGDIGGQNDKSSIKAAGTGGTGLKGLNGDDGGRIEIIVTGKVAGDGTWEINNSGMKGGKGQKGGTGGTGSTGYKGNDAKWDKPAENGGPAGDGGKGGTGGTGGNGGNAGKVEVNNVIAARISAQQISVIQKGGDQGDGGDPGEGGAPGREGSGGHGWGLRSGGKSGKSGQHGKEGDKGPEGTSGRDNSIRIINY